MNKVMLTGRIAHDLDLRYTPSGTAVLQFNIAINRPKDENGEQKADFPTIVVWGKQAENLNKYQKKGSQIGIIGRIQTRNYDNNEGKKVYVTEVIAENVEFLESKKDDSNFKNLTETQPTNNTSEELTEDPYANFGNQITLDDLDSVVNDNDLPF